MPIDHAHSSVIMPTRAVRSPASYSASDIGSIATSALPDVPLLLPFRPNKQTQLPRVCCVAHWIGWVLAGPFQSIDCRRCHPECSRFCNQYQDCQKPVLRVSQLRADDLALLADFDTAARFPHWAFKPGIACTTASAVACNCSA